MELATPRRSASQKLADFILGEPVEEWILRRRPAKSWDKIARELATITRGDVDVKDMTVWRWVAGRLDELNTQNERRR